MKQRQESDKIESGLLGSGTIALHRTDLQQLADDRVLDAEALLHRWAVVGRVLPLRVRRSNAR